MLQIIINIFWLIKIKTKSFGISYYNHIFFHFYNDLIDQIVVKVWWFYYADVKDIVFV